MAITTAKRKPKAKKKTKHQPKVFTYQWKGVNRDGQRTSGELKGSTIAEIRSVLKSQGVTPKAVRKKSAPLWKMEKNITAMDIAMITRQIATMLAAGVPLVTTIELLGRGPMH
jgi:type IV pilus assembly protein PilC